MAQPTQSYFATLTYQIESILDEVSLHRLNFNQDRALWEMHGSFGQYYVQVKLDYQDFLE